MRSDAILIFLLLFSNACISQKKAMSVNEQSSIHLFNDFINYLLTTKSKKEDIGDDAHLKYVLLNYVFSNKPLDSSNQTTIGKDELTPDQLIDLKKNLNDFYNFLQAHEKEHLAEHLTLMPIRLSYDTAAYKRLSNYQKENTFVLYDNRFPHTTLSYVLFIPPIKNILASTRIWSWTLQFKFGKYLFKSVTGEEGYEYIFSPKD